MLRHRLLVVTSALALVPACESPDQGRDDAGPDPGIHLPGGAEDGGDAEDPAATENELLGSMTDAFDAAARDYDIPVEVLKSIAFAETRWEMIIGEEEFDGHPAAFGAMALRGDQVARGAELTGHDEVQVKFVAAANIRAGAAILDEIADGMTFDRDDLGAWAPAIAAYSGIEDAEAQAGYIHNEVYAVMRSGILLPTLEGNVSMMGGIDVEPDFQQPLPPPQMAQGPDYAGSVWRPSPNYSSRPAGDIGKVAMVIIHTCEGAYSGCYSWLQNTQAGASAHYVVNSTGSEISQLVKESNKAWHIAATYKCSLNSSKECWRDGYSSNNFTVGIEHAGYASQKSWDPGLIDASAKLTCDITKAYGIARDKYHIVGHGQLQPYNRVDPGPNWPWTSYIQKVNSFCGQNPQPDPQPDPQPQPEPNPTTIVVDSNNNKNDPAVAKIAVSANWTSSSSTAGYYGTGYWFANTEAVSDGATFSFYLPQAGSKVVEAWWTAGTNRSDAAPFIAYDASGNKLGTVKLNQKQNGSKWVAVGTFNFTKGWNKVVLSRWTTAGSVVIADAIRIK